MFPRPLSDDWGFHHSSTRARMVGSEKLGNCMCPSFQKLYAKEIYDIILYTCLQNLETPWPPYLQKTSTSATNCENPLFGPVGYDTFMTNHPRQLLRAAPAFLKTGQKRTTTGDFSLEPYQLAASWFMFDYADPKLIADDVCSSDRDHALMVLLRRCNQLAQPLPAANMH